MDSVKQWITGRPEPHVGFKTVVVTPKNIPAFTIPPRNETSLRRKSESSDCVEGRSSSMSSGSSACSVHHPGQSSFVRSAPTSPNVNDRSYTFAPIVSPVSTTDPQAIGTNFTHLQTETKFGFATVRERPNSRRKESLFHDGEVSAFARSASRRNKSPVDGHPPLYSTQSFTSDTRSRRTDTEVAFVRRYSHKRRNVPSLVAPLGVILSGKKIKRYIMNVLLRH